VLVIAISLSFLATFSLPLPARSAGPVMFHPRLGVRPVVAGLASPIALAFLGPNDLLVLEKATGRVQRVLNGAVQGAVLDLGVNFASERGLLGIALHPSFPANPGVYLFWSCVAPPPAADNPHAPSQHACSDDPGVMFGPDSGDTLAAPLLGNRVDRFVWNGATLTYERNLVMLRSFQHDAAPQPPNQGDQAQPARANHDGGVLAFGPDRKLYILFGDAGRRSQLQNLPMGPTTTGPGNFTLDDQFGGPYPDDAHFTGVILRLNDDGSTPTDNPFYRIGGEVGGEVGQNVQQIYAYGLRNSFGMAFDPISGRLWQQENGEDAFDELNLVERGFNSGWIQVAGPLARIAQYRDIETTSLNNEDFPNLQQFRWPPVNIATTPDEARARMFVLPGSSYSDPEFSWKHVLAPAAIGFARSRTLGAEFYGDLFVGFSLPFPLGGALFRFNLTGNRRAIAVDDARLTDRVADNLTFYDMTESESLLIGGDFGIITDIKTGPNGNLYVVSLSEGSIYEVYRR
jgi:glucose/arabinose dehydrogenase